jgi:hypothetical protein
VNESIVPFVRERGLSWVLPLHETVETFLAGVVFAVSSNFILIGSTKIASVIAIYGDLVVGFPLRLIGGLGWRRLEDTAIGEKASQESEAKRPWWQGPKPRVAPPLEEVLEANAGTPAGKAQILVWGLLLGAGRVSGGARSAVEAADLFVGRYLLITTVGYVALKFIHFKIFDPFP